MLLTLTVSRGTAPALIGCGGSRRPLSSTSVLPEPRPRRFTDAASPRASLGPVDPSWFSSALACGMYSKSSVVVAGSRR